MSKPAFVFVPGILHTPAHFKPLTDILEQHGYDATCVPLPNIGENAATAAPWDDAKAVRDVLEHMVVKANREIVLVCHSYGGVPGCQAVRGLEISTRQKSGESGGIIQVIFLNAFVVKEGETALGALIKAGQDPPPWIQPDPSNEKLLKPNDLVGEYLFSDMTEDARASWIVELRPINANHQTTPVKSDCWEIDVPKTYIFSDDDRGLWPQTQRAMLDQVVNDSWSVKHIASGHAPFLSQPDTFAKMLLSEANAHARGHVETA